MTSPDSHTASAFAKSWNNLPGGSVYSRDQVIDWMSPLTPEHFYHQRVLELGCGNGSLMAHVIDWNPAHLTGVDLGESVQSAQTNLQATGKNNWTVDRADLCSYAGGGADVVYCIGVLHHLQNPEAGFTSVVNNTKPGGRFHCWVYAYEGNALVRWLVEPLRKITCRLPWWFTKHVVATLLSLPVFTAARLLSLTPHRLTEMLPLGLYLSWLGRREWAFSRHVVFDQLVTPQTAYIKRKTLEAWLSSDSRIDPASTYIIRRNGNSWKFGGSRTLTH